MKNPTDDDAYDALFRSYEAANKRIKELDSQLADEQARNASNVANAELQIAELKAEIVKLNADLVIEKDGHSGNLGIADLQIAELSDEIEDYKKQLAAAQAEVTRLRAGGCARDQHTTQYCGEMQSLIARLTALAEEFQTEETWDGKRNDALRYCAGRLREAIGGGDANQVGLLDIADAVIAEREGK